MRSFTWQEDSFNDSNSEDDPPDDRPPFTQEERAALVAAIVRTIWRVIAIATEHGAKPLQTIAFYCKGGKDCAEDVKYVYYAVHSSDQHYGSVRIESIRHNVDGPLYERTLRELSDRQLRELAVIVTHELTKLKSTPKEK